MKNWLPLVMLAVGACTQTGTPGSLPASPVIGLELVTPNAAQLNGSLLTKSANATPQTLRIHHRSLGKSFLYIAAITETSSPASKFQPYQPRLVQFKKAGQTIILEDVRPHQRYSTNSTLPRIVSQFPIIHEDVEGIEFDFATGVKSTLWLESKPRSDTESTFQGASPPHSYIANIVSTPEMISFDHHFSQIKKGETVVIRHIFKTDVASPFTPQESHTNNRFGYFVTPPWYDQGDSQPNHYITRWALNRPIEVALDPNIPPSVRPAFEEALLAWNTAVGHELFALSRVAADRGPLDLRFDIGINWIDNDDDGSAYGYTFSHPVSGETLHGDILFPSGWWRGAKKESKSVVTQVSQPVTNGFESAEVCRYAGENDEKDVTAELTSADLQMTYIHMIVRTVLTHELGHILGLRHNFAGNTDGNWTLPKFREFLQQVKDGTAPNDNPLPSSSIMDYLPTHHTIMMTRPGPYDVQAIQWGYFQNQFKESDHAYRFCTDQSTNDGNMNFGNGNIADCQRFDSGIDPLDRIDNELKFSIGVYITNTTRIAQKTMAQLETQAVTDTPNLAPIATWLYRLHNYLTGDMAVWALNGKTPLERMEKAHTIWKKLPSLIQSQELAVTLDTLELKIKSGDEDTQLWAKEVQFRIQIALKKLQMLLDLKPGSLNKKPNGTTADSDYGD